MIKQVKSLLGMEPKKVSLHEVAEMFEHTYKPLSQEERKETAHSYTIKHRLIKLR